MSDEETETSASDMGDLEWKSECILNGVVVGLKCLLICFMICCYVLILTKIVEKHVERRKTPPTKHVFVIFP